MRAVLSILFLVLPLAEIATFVAVGSQIGVLATLGLVLLSGLVGLLLMRAQGMSAMARVRAELDAGQVPGRDLVDAFMILAAGILLLIPGFLTDIVGILLFLPPVRHFLWSRIGRNMVIVTSRPAPGAREPRRAGPVIDLEDDQYRRDPDPNSPWRQP